MGALHEIPITSVGTSSVCAGSPQSPTRMISLDIRLFLVLCCWWGLSSVEATSIQSDNSGTASGRMWEHLLDESEQLHMPTTFLKAPPGVYSL